MTEQLRVVGQPVPRVDGVAKVTGAAKFTVDLTLPGMTHGCVVRSERAHARIIDIDTDEAERVPGVINVVTAADAAGLDIRFGHLARDNPALAVDRTRHHGEPVALVVACTRSVAAHAARLVRVEYEDLPAVLDAEAALAPDAPVLHPERAGSLDDREFKAVGVDRLEGNLCNQAELGWGDVEAELEDSDVVISGEFRYPMLYAYAMEPYSALAAFEAGALTVYSSAQHPYIVREDLARMFRLPLARVRVVVPYVGGGFGSKSYTKIEPLTALGAWVTRRPVKLALSVEEAIHTTRSEPAQIRVRSGFAADGTLRAREFDIVINSGAYTHNSPILAAKAATRCFGPYRVPAVRVRVRSVFTNTVPGSSQRGFGAPQTNLAGEVQIDEAAVRLGIDPVDLRLRNLVGPGEELLPGRRPLDADLRADLRELARLVGWGERESGRGIGFGLSASDAGGFPTSVSTVRIHPDGSASALVGASELGQGSATVLAQIVAEELGLEMDLVSIVASDTAVSSYERTTGASRTTALAGRSLQAACRDARRRVREMAAALGGVEPAAVRDALGGVEVDGRRRDYAEIVRDWFVAGGEVVGTGAVGRRGEFEQLPPFWEIGAGGVVVSVDEETGRIRVERLATVGDVGLAINPALLRSQDMGGAMMGLGAALSEQLVYEGETLLNPNVVDYRVPRVSDVPAEVVHAIVERRDGIGPYGAKGGGEGSVNPVGGAVAAAVGRAIGVFPHELPLTPERVWRLTRTKTLNLPISCDRISDV